MTEKYAHLAPEYLREEIVRTARVVEPVSGTSGSSGDGAALQVIDSTGNSPVAQSVEHLTVNQGVAGSSPARGATFRAKSTPVSWPELRPDRSSRARSVGQFHDPDHDAPLQIILHGTIEERATRCRPEDARRLDTFIQQDSLDRFHPPVTQLDIVVDGPNGIRRAFEVESQMRVIAHLRHNPPQRSLSGGNQLRAVEGEGYEDDGHERTLRSRPIVIVTGRLRGCFPSPAILEIGDPIFNVVDPIFNVVDPDFDLVESVALFAGPGLDLDEAVVHFRLTLAEQVLGPLFRRNAAGHRNRQSAQNDSESDTVSHSALVRP